MEQTLRKPEGQEGLNKREVGVLSGGSVVTGVGRALILTDLNTTLPFLTMKRQISTPEEAANSTPLAKPEQFLLQEPKLFLMVPRGLMEREHLQVLRPTLTLTLMNVSWLK